MTRISSLRRRLLLPALFLVLGAAPAVLLPGCKSDIEKNNDNHTAEQKVKDDEAIRAYLAAKNITNFTRTESGLYLVPLTNGTGEQVAKGNVYQLNYVGSFLNGIKFDSSIDNDTPCNCITIGVTASNVVIKTVKGDEGTIDGWGEGIPLFKVGDRKTLLIPSYLAYGAAGNLGVPADTPLMFDIEILKKL